MLINLILPDNYRIDYSNIESLSYGALLYISVIATHSCYFSPDLTNTINLIFRYFFIDLFFLPPKKVDIIFHHITVIFLIYSSSIYDIPSPLIETVARIVLKFETTNIFLCTSYFFKRIKKHVSTPIVHYASNVSNILLVSSFIKYRCYDILIHILYNKNLYNELHEYNSIAAQYTYNCVNAFFLLNCYWLFMLIKMANKNYRT